MRFNVGEKHLFMTIFYTEAAQRPWAAMYLPWCDKLDEVFVIELECIEHHRVPGEWDDEIKYDGYVFKDKTGKIWHNQYPRASYGQLSADADYYVRPHDHDGHPRFEAKIFPHMEHAAVSIGRIIRGIRDIKKRIDDPEEKQPKAELERIIKSLEQHLVDLTLLFKLNWGTLPVDLGCTLAFTDGRPTEHYPDIPNVWMLPWNPPGHPAFHELLSDEKRHIGERTMVLKAIQHHTDGAFAYDLAAPELANRVFVSGAA